MKSNSESKLRCSEGYYDYEEKKYIIPVAVKLFLSKSGKLCYLSGLRNSTMKGFNDKYIATVKFVEENRFEDVDYEIIKKFL